MCLCTNGQVGVWQQLSAKHAAARERGLCRLRALLCDDPEITHHVQLLEQYEHLARRLHLLQHHRQLLEVLPGWQPHRRYQGKAVGGAQPEVHSEVTQVRSDASVGVHAQQGDDEGLLGTWDDGAVGGEPSEGGHDDFAAVEAQLGGMAAQVMGKVAALELRVADLVSFVVDGQQLAQELGVAGAESDVEVGLWEETGGRVVKAGTGAAVGGAHLTASALANSALVARSAAGNGKALLPGSAHPVRPGFEATGHNESGNGSVHGGGAWGVDVLRGQRGLGLSGHGLQHAGGMV